MAVDVVRVILFGAVVIRCVCVERVVGDVAAVVVDVIFGVEPVAVCEAFHGSIFSVVANLSRLERL